MSNRARRHRHRNHPRGRAIDADLERDARWAVNQALFIANDFDLPYEAVLAGVSQLVAARGMPAICGMCNTVHNNADPGCFVAAADAYIFLTSPCDSCYGALELMATGLELEIGDPPWFADWITAIETSTIPFDRNGDTGILVALYDPAKL